MPVSMAGTGCLPDDSMLSRASTGCLPEEGEEEGSMERRLGSNRGSDGGCVLALTWLSSCRGFDAGRINADTAFNDAAAAFRPSPPIETRDSEAISACSSLGPPEREEEGGQV